MSCCKTPVQAVVFDLAGTTVDYGSCAPAGAFIELFARHGVEVTNAEARGPMGTHKRDHIRALIGMPRVAELWKATHDGAATEQDIDALYEEFIPLQVACLPDYSELIPGTLEAMAELRASGIKIGATTGYNREMLGVVLGACAKQGFEPDVAVCAEDVREGRPAPWMLFRAMDELGVYPASAVVAVGDTLPDIDSGLNAGAWAIGVTKTGNMLGLPRAEADALAADELAARLAKATEVMTQAGAHAVVEGIEGVPEAVRRLAG